MYWAIFQIIMVTTTLPYVIALYKILLLIHLSKLCEVLDNKFIYAIVSRPSLNSFATIIDIAIHRLRNTALT
jgi:hypothetical protein